VHDTVDLELRGVPAVFVATTEFTEAAERQARALGMNAARVFVAHPVQDRTRDELLEMADGAVEALLEALTRR